MREANFNNGGSKTPIMGKGATIYKPNGEAKAYIVAQVYDDGYRCTLQRMRAIPNGRSGYTFKKYTNSASTALDVHLKRGSGAGSWRIEDPDSGKIGGFVNVKFGVMEERPKR